MKKLLVLLAITAFSVVSVNAGSRTIGGRLGYGAELAYQHNLGARNMLELEIGAPGFYGLSAAATYDWIFPITSWTHAGAWNWYLGVGAGGGYSFHGKRGWDGDDDDYGYVGLAGRIGVEYNFVCPWNISLDWRPIIGPSFHDDGMHFNGYGLYEGGIALGIRYRF